MTIESDFASIKINLGRIADSLEALASSQGIVPEPPGKPEPEEKAPAKKKAAPKKKAAAKKAPAKKKATKKAPAKKEETAESKLTIKDDVRPILRRLRDEVNHGAVKTLLKKFGANTIQDVEEKDFERLIELAKAELGDEDDEQEDMFDDFDEDVDDVDEDDDL